MGAAPSSSRGVCRPFVPAEFAVAWLTFKGDLVENTDHRYVAKKDGLLSSKLLQRLYGASTIKIFADEEGEFVSREMFVCSLALCYEGNTEDRISYIFTMYSIIYGMERENEGCMLKKDYVYVLEYLEGYSFIPKKFYDAFDECQVPANGMMQNSQFIEWVRMYPVLMEFLASHLPPAVADQVSPSGHRDSDEFLGSDPLNNSPSCRDRERSGAGSQMFGSFDFIGGEDSGDDSDEAYDSDQIDDMDEFGEFQSAPMTTTNSGEYRDSVGGDGSDEDLVDGSNDASRSSIESVGAISRGQRKSRGVRKMRNLTKTLGGGISKVGNVGRTILHGGKGLADTPTSSHGDLTPANLMMAGYSFSSESQISKNYVCGYLHKISDGKWSKRSWHRRWFVLDRQQGVLSYYRLNPANQITSAPRGNIVHMDDDDTTNSQAHVSKDHGTTPGGDVEATSEPTVAVTSPKSLAAASTNGTDKNQPHHMLYLNKSHPWYRGELNLNIENVSLLFEKSLARNAPTKYFFQVSTLSLQEIDSKRGVQYKLCAESEEDFDQWTLAIADAINRKHTLHPPGPKLSHQQLYRQKLIEEEHRRQEEEMMKQANSATDANATITKQPSSQALPQPQSTTLPGNGKPSTGPKSTHEKTSTSSSSKRGKKSSSPAKPNAPPRIVTYCPSAAIVSPHSQWRLQVNVEGSKQCLIVGFMINIIALKCVAPEHALWKLLVCVAVTCAYVTSVYNPPSTRRVGNGPPQMMRRASEIPGVLDANVLSTEPTECMNPETCCLHKIQQSFNDGQNDVAAEEIGIATPAFVLPPMGGFKMFPLGLSMVRTESTASGKSSKIPQSWTTTRGETFQIRSQDYKKTKRKEPSKGALFEFVGADLLRTDGKIDLVSQRLELPDEYANDKVFIINAQLPSYGPSVWGDQSCDGPGFSLILVWKIPPEICEELKDPKSRELRLFKRFQQAGSDTSLTDRFKVIAQVTNQDECGLTGMAKKLLVSHNATPVLTRPQHRIYHFNEGSTELVVDIHAFSYIARRGIHMLLDKCAKLVIDIAFVLQGETEDELPERVLGCCRLDCVDVAKATDFPR